MKTILTQDFLRHNPAALQYMQENLHIKAKAHGKYPNLLLFKYDQINSPMENGIVQECRGLILDSANNWEVVAHPFHKFFNYGEANAAEIDWDTACVQEKVDGSLCVMYHYNNQWHVATSGTPDASGEVHGNSITFDKLFWETYNKYENQHGFTPCTNHTYMFELTSPINRIVVPHAEPGLTIIGCRNNKTGVECAPHFARAFLCRMVPLVKEFGLQTAQEITESFAAMNPMAQEGYVVVDKNFNRIKVKHPGYVAIHHVATGTSRRAMVEIARSGESSEVIASFPALAAELQDIKDKLGALESELLVDYKSRKDIESQKDFAISLNASSCRLKGALFSLRAGKVDTIREYLASMNLDTLIGLL